MTMAHVDVLLAFALVVVVPLSIGLQGAKRRRVEAAVVAGAAAALSFLMPQGLPAALLASVWVAVPGLLIVGFADGSRLRDMRGRGEMLAVAYLLVGTGWLVLSRFGARPLGFSAQIVELTAVHFHYAGFVTPTLLARLVDWLQSRSSGADGVSSVAYWTVLVATPITAAGITFSAAIGVLGALLFTVGLFVASGVILGQVVSRVPRRAAVALSVSASSVIVSMLLALSYAFGQWLGTPAPSIRMMAWTHGILNAVGFAFLGVVGWLLVDQTQGRPRKGYKRRLAKSSAAGADRAPGGRSKA